MVAPLGARSCGGCSRRFLCCLRRSTCSLGGGWRLILFGAKIGKHVLIRPGVSVTYPWNLTIGDYVWIGDNVILYSVAEISIGSHSVISQEAYLCAGTHDYRDVSFPFVSAPIQVADECWIAARVFIGPGVKIGHAAVIGAGSIVMKDVDPLAIMVGNPAKFVRKRIRKIRMVVQLV